MFLECLAVGAGGFFGSALRYLMGMIPALNKVDFPFHTMLINILGAVIIGMIVKFSDSWEAMSGYTLLLLTAGFCGGFTTFSTFALESAEMIEAGRIAETAAYAVLSVLLCIGGVYIGKYLAGAIGI